MRSLELIRVVATTWLLVILTHYAAVLPHEFGHSLMAWILGWKANPLAIHWGAPTVFNILTLIEIDEAVDYDNAFAAGARQAVTAIALAGPIFANATLFAVSRWLWARKCTTLGVVAAQALFWFIFMNLVNLYVYIPIRTFSPTGDVAHFVQATDISPWAIYVIGGSIVAVATVDFF